MGGTEHRVGADNAREEGVERKQGGEAEPASKEEGRDGSRGEEEDGSEDGGGEGQGGGWPGQLAEGLGWEARGYHGEGMTVAVCLSAVLCCRGGGERPATIPNTKYFHVCFCLRCQIAYIPRAK